MNGPAPATTKAPARQHSALLALFAALALAFTSLGAIAPSAASAPSAADAGRMLVTAAGSVDDAVAAIVEVGGTVINRFDVFGVVVADVADAGALEADRRVQSVAADTVIAPQWDDNAESADVYDGDSGSPGVLAPPSYTAGATIGAGALHAAGHDGTGIGVAVIDTGIASNPLLRGKVVASVDTSTTPNGRDGLGHGTFMAGLIAGQSGASGKFKGIAPGAHLVDIKVANSDGRATVSGLIAGLAAAHRAHDVFDVKVVLLAAGAHPEAAGEAGTALVRSLEQLWRDGMVVVVPAGNEQSYVATPGVSQYVITAGAIDDGGTADTAKDQLWANSGGGPVEAGSKPDVLAPGVSLVSTRAAGSSADAENAASRIGGKLFRGTGTSMAAAVTAGAAALLLDADEQLTPNEVKTKLVTAARAEEGRVAGTLDLVGALDAPTTPDVNPSVELIDDIPDQNLEDDPVVPPNGHSWVGHSWVGHSWVGHSWVGHSWVDDSWVGHSWVGHSWVGHSWVGHSWVGHSWVGHSWVGHSWVGHSWVGYNWQGTSWV